MFGDSGLGEGCLSSQASSRACRASSWCQRRLGIHSPSSFVRVRELCWRWLFRRHALRWEAEPSPDDLTFQAPAEAHDLDLGLEMFGTSGGRF